MTNSLRPMALLLGVLLIASSCDDGSAKVKNGTTPQAPSADSGSDAYSSSRHAPKIRAADCTRLATVFETSTQDVIATSRMRCATLGVPVDHAKPSGKQITIAFARLAATGPRSQRLGAVMVNPGGPGGSGIEFLAQAGEQFPEELTKRFDIVAFDPRGVGASTQLTCLTQAQLKAWIEAKPIKDPKKARTQSLKDETTLRDACLKTSKDLFLHIGTDQVVADLEDLRIALGNEPMNFFGMSYGTDIAAGYVSRYPEHVRAIVLDGSLNPDRSLETRALGQTQSIERAMAAFIARCDASPTCPLAPTAETQIKAIVEQFEAGSTLPPAKKHGKRFDAGDFETALVTSLYEPAAWDGTYEAIDALFGPDTTKQALAVKVLSNFAAQQTGKRADGTYDNSSEVLRTVTCQDAESPLTAKEGEGIRKQLEAIVKGTVLESANDPASEVIEACTILPAADRLAITATSAAMRVLVIGNTGDPVTPIEFARSMSKALGNAPLITYAGNGHTAGLRIDCVTTQLVDFFVTAGVGFTAKDCVADPDEFDLYLEIEKSFEAAGMPSSARSCALDRLKKAASPLQILSIGEDDVDGPLVKAIQAAVLSC